MTGTYTINKSKLKQLFIKEISSNTFSFLRHLEGGCSPIKVCVNSHIEVDDPTDSVSVWAQTGIRGTIICSTAAVRRVATSASDKETASNKIPANPAGPLEENPAG